MPVALIVPENDEKHKQLMNSNLFSTFVQEPVGYADIVKIMEEYVAWIP
jgi:hypothetical protein